MTAEEMDLQAVLSIFIPGEQAAICADCGGVFLLTARHCPGCGSKQWVLLVPPLIAASLNKEDR